jgi:DNA-binding SARP family transcriptional activator
MMRLLGEIGVHAEGRAVDLGPPKQRCVAAVLAVEAGQVVPADRLVERVWGADAPPRTRTTLHSYVSRLRAALAGVDGVVVTRRSGGYALEADPELFTVDLHLARELRAAARTEAERAPALLGRALALWRGDALTGLAGEWAEAERERLGQERLALWQDLVDVQLRRGLGEDLVVELAARVREHPLDERTAGQYLTALHQAGRTADALQHFQVVRERLAEELGVDPAAPLQELHQRLLTADAPPAPAAEAGEPVLPRQLPAAPASFVGRRADLSSLDDLLAGPGPAGTVAISAIAGAGGIGKTWLALSWAHRHAGEFPDGRLFVDLRGFSPEDEPMAPAVAVRGFLEALGVQPGRIPAEPHAQAALFRSLVAGRRMLLVLDNAATTAQVVPLLPGSPGCTVIVTSRNRLSGLITGHGARQLLLDVLIDDEARALLADRLGEARLKADPAAVDRLIGLCGGYPLALSIIAGQAHTRPHLPLPVLADELHDLGLGALDDDDPAASLPTVLSWSHQTLSPDQAAMFALLAIAPGADISIAAAASLAGCSPTAARARLRGLEDASLITQDVRGRYGMHDLIRRYAVDVAHRDLTGDERAAALRRVFDFYLHTGFRGERLLAAFRHPIRLEPPAPGSLPQPLRDVPAAVAWFDAEYATLMAAQQLAVTLGWHRDVWRLSWILTTFHYRRADREKRQAVWQLAVDAANHLDDPEAEIVTHAHLGHALADLRRYDEAAEHLNTSLTSARRQGDLAGQAYAEFLLGQAWAYQEDYRTGIEHSHRALELYRALGDPLFEAIVLNQLGWFRCCLAEFGPARDHLEAALTLIRRHHSPANEAHTLGNLGYLAQHTGRYSEALAYYAESLVLLHEVGDSHNVAVALDWTGQTHRSLGQEDQARAVWREALELYREQGRHQAADRLAAELGTGDS